jgi:PEP-CTERM motif
MRVAASTFASTLLLAALLAIPMLGVAAPCTTTISPPGLGLASTEDVTLGGFFSDACHVYVGNAQAGPFGDPSGFDPVPFGTGWQGFVKVDEAGVITDLAGGPPLTLTFGTSPTGTWGLTSTEALVIDLVFAMHAGGRTGAFLFDNESFAANVPRTGTWLIEWLNNGGQVPAYSNLTIFWRDERTQVPEPGTLALLAAALVAIGSWRVRRSRG